MVARKTCWKVKFFQVVVWKFPSLYYSSWSLKRSKLLGLMEKSLLKLAVRLYLLDFGLTPSYKLSCRSLETLLSFFIPSSSKLWRLIEKSFLKLPVRMYFIVIIMLHNCISSLGLFQVTRQNVTLQGIIWLQHYKPSWRFEVSI